MSKIAIPQGGGATVHVFALPMGMDEAGVFVARPQSLNGAGWPLKVALGAKALDADGVELVDPADLAGLGLSTYLVDGVGIDPDSITAKTALLDALKDPLVILHPRAFGPAEQTLAPQPPLRHIGSYPLARGATTMEKLHTPSAEGRIVAEPPATGAPPSRALKWAASAAAALVVIGLLIALTGGFR